MEAFFNSIILLQAPWNIILMSIVVTLMVGVVAALFFIIIKSGLKLAFKQNILSIGGKNNYPQNTLIITEDNFNSFILLLVDAVQGTIEETFNRDLADKMDIAINKIDSIYIEHMNNFKELLKTEGVDERCLTTHIDYQTFELALKVSFYTNNGQECVKSLIREDIKFKRYPRENNSLEIESYINDFYIKINKLISSAFDRYYTNQINMRLDKTSEFRLVTTNEILEINKKLKQLVKNKIKEIVLASQKIDEGFPKKKEEVLEDKINKLKNIILNKGDKNV
jgi:hypothetical protein